jgi:hypothetical protein
MNSESLRNASKLFLRQRKSIVTSDATEALLSQKFSNGSTVDGYRGIALTQIEMQWVVIEQSTSQVSWGRRFRRTRNKGAAKNYQHRIYNWDIRKLAFVCHQTRKCVWYLFCVIYARVQINSLVKSGESTIYSCRVNPKQMTILWHDAWTPELCRQRTITETSIDRKRISKTLIRDNGWTCRNQSIAIFSNMLYVRNVHLTKGQTYS